MPIDYKKYPPNWRSEIRPRIMNRANNTCEFEGCDFKHLEKLWAVKRNGKTQGWFRNFEEAEKLPKSIESKKNKKTGITELVPNPKKIKVILTIAHLDHDETNHDVKDERLKAACQLCHLRYDAKEKYRRSLNVL
jgi:hypothetical protein